MLDRHRGNDSLAIEPDLAEKETRQIERLDQELYGCGNGLPRTRMTDTRSSPKCKSMARQRPVTVDARGRSSVHPTP